mgnify:CR=1 FL=1
MSRIITRSKAIIFLLQLFILAVASLSKENEVVPQNVWRPATAENPAVTELHNEYHNIFHHGNRNAASHRWATFLLQRSTQMTFDRLIFFLLHFAFVYETNDKFLHQFGMFFPCFQCRQR